MNRKELQKHIEEVGTWYMGEWLSDPSSITDAVIQLEERLVHKIKFYENRLNLIQKYQKELPEPYRTQICNILANGEY
jgi:hypothetical protein